MFLKWGQSDQSVPIGSNYFFLQGIHAINYRTSFYKFYFIYIKRDINNFRDYLSNREAGAFADV